MAALEPGDLFHFEIIAEAPPSQFTTNPALLVSAPRRLGKSRLRAVDPYDPRPKGPGHALASRFVFRHHGGGKAETGVVRKPQRLLLVGKALHPKHGAKNLVAPDRRIQGYICKDRRLEEVAA